MLHPKSVCITAPNSGWIRRKLTAMAQSSFSPSLESLSGTCRHRPTDSEQLTSPFRVDEGPFGVVLGARHRDTGAALIMKRLFVHWAQDDTVRRRILESELAVYRDFHHVRLLSSRSM